MTHVISISRPNTEKKDWLLVDTGANNGETNMALDRSRLEAMEQGAFVSPLLRFFEWEETTITYGYLLDPEKIRPWADQKGINVLVQRPTGGGAVIHTTNDLSLSLLWRRDLELFSNKPRECYAQIHTLLKNGVQAYLGTNNTSLFVKPLHGCQTTEPVLRETERFSDCFQEPVCNDVMLGHQKIVGGALRLTRNAILYQGTIHLPPPVDKKRLKDLIRNAL